LKLVLTSDWHGYLPFPDELPEGDVLIVAGDLCPVWNHDRKFQANWLRGHLRPYLADLPYEKIILIAGNHDFVLEDSKVLGSQLDSEKVVYLKDAGFVHEGVSFWGSPWSGLFYNWAFMKDEAELATIYAGIPEHTQILISHGPPWGVCDYTLTGQIAGSKALRERILDMQPQPKIVVTGHIHEAYGSDFLGATEILNVSLNDADYRPTQEPVVYEL